MTEKLPLLSAQLAFGLEAQRSGRRVVATLMFRTSPSRLSTADVSQVLRSIVLQNPALSCRIRFSRGAAYQEWCPEECDFAELHAESGEAASRRVVEVVEEFETSLDGAPISARLIRSPSSDDLLLVFDHALVDEKSLLLIRRQLNAPSAPNGGRWERYKAAINDRKVLETVASNGPGIEFWAERLKTAVGGFPRMNEEAPTLTVPVAAFPGVAIPRSFRGSLFPYVLFSLHRALRDIAAPAPTVIGYPWGSRNAAYSDVVGCFMNTVVSLDPAGSQQVPGTLDGFLWRWYREIDHADVPFSAVTALGSAFSGSVTAQLSYWHAAERTLEVAGTPAVEIPSSHSRTSYTSNCLAAATVRGDEIQFRLFLDEETAGYGAQELGARWCHWLDKTLASIPGRKHRSLDDQPHGE
ncbi:hypothetical protein JYK22_02165, partial [Nonomuraea sp. RK-328]|nr:hypothetical protein [Nonomuraea sp. RK-328]